MQVEELWKQSMKKSLSLCCDLLVCYRCWQTGDRRLQRESDWGGGGREQVTVPHVVFEGRLNYILTGQTYAG